MKRKILLGIVLGTILLFMTGCCMQHEWVTADCVAPQTCNKCGKTEGDALGHKWEDATCASAKTCTVCGKTEGDVLDHKWEDATCIDAKACTVCGKTEGEALGHKWEAATCTDAKTCTACGKTEGNALGHRMQIATCTSAKTCKLCGMTEGDALGHKWEEATCTSAKTCQRCHKKEGSSLGHEWEAATCTKPRTCKTCKQTEGSARGHNIDIYGWCDECNTKVGTNLSNMYYGSYITVEARSSKDELGCLDGYMITVKSKNENRKFYNAEVEIEWRLYYDDALGRTQYKTTRTQVLALDENGNAIYTGLFSELEKIYAINRATFGVKGIRGYVTE